MISLKKSVVFLLLAAAAALPRPASAQAVRKLDRALQAIASTPSAAPQSIIISAQSGQLAAVRTWLKSNGDAIESEQPALNAVTAKVRPDHLAKLAELLETRSISLNAPVSAFAAPSAPTAAAATVLRATLGLNSTSPTGKGIGIAIVDTGIQPSTDFEGRFTAFYDFVNAGGRFTSAYDDHGHGTHIAGLIASNGSLGSQYTGVAPGARLIGLKVLDANGIGKTSDVVNALAFATANKQLLGIDVINLSLGHPIYESAKTDPLVQAVEAASRAGIIVVTASGNAGINPSTGEPGYAGITSPGNAPSAITVGAFDHKGTVSRADDRMAPYSSAGPTWYDGQVKPDIVAPGHRLGSDAYRTQTLYKTYASLRLDSSHIVLSGTSMASAVTAGAVAVVLEANRTANGYPARPSLTPNAMKAVLQYTALRMHAADGVDYDALRQGAGALNVGGAVEVARSIDTAAATGAWWLTSGVISATTIDGQLLSWAQNIVWGTNFVWGTSIFVNEPAWAQNIVWGTISESDNIVWGTLFDSEADNIVWGTFNAEADNIVWGTNIVWSSNIVWGTGLVDVTGLNIVWGTLSASNIVWGTNIVWSNQILQ